MTIANGASQDGSELALHDVEMVERSAGEGGAGQESHGEKMSEEMMSEEMTGFRYDTERSGILIDAVVAIAATLMGVKLPELGESSEKEVAAKISSYLWSFFITLGLWRDHASSVGRASRRYHPFLVLLNSLWVYCVACVPLVLNVFLDKANAPVLNNEMWANWVRGTSIFVLGASVIRSLEMVLLQVEADKKQASRTESNEQCHWTVRKRLACLLAEFPAPALAFGMTFVIVGNPGVAALLLIFRDPLVTVTAVALKAEPISCGTFHGGPKPAKIRVVQITDGIFAISMTLLSIEASPALTPGVGVDGAWVTIGLYTMCFFSLLILWHLHNSLYQHLGEEEINLVVYLLSTLTVTLIPISTGGFKSMMSLVSLKEENSTDTGAEPQPRELAEDAESSLREYQGALRYALSPLLVWLGLFLLLTVYCIFKFTSSDKGKQAVIITKLSGISLLHSEEKEDKQQELLSMYHRRSIWMLYLLVRVTLLFAATIVVVGLSHTSMNPFTLLWAWLVACMLLTALCWVSLALQSAWYPKII